jgi:hypothetical protein
MIDACLVGSVADGVLLAFRGTLPLDFHRYPTVLDWLNDFNAIPVTTAGFPGQIHPGFYGALSVLWPPVLAEIQRQRTGPLAALPVFVTGHSKGGAMAVMAAWLLRAAQIPVTVVTFAAAKAGDVAFRDAFNEAGILHTRYECTDDIVPHLPPSQDGFMQLLSALRAASQQYAALPRFDYLATGTLQFIDWSDGIEADSDELHDERTTSLALKIVRGQFGEILADHSIACGSGYMRAVCPLGVCS